MRCTLNYFQNVFTCCSRRRRNTPLKCPPSMSRLRHSCHQPSANYCNLQNVLRVHLSCRRDEKIVVKYLELSEANLESGAKASALLRAARAAQVTWITRSIRKGPLNHGQTDVRFAAEIAGNLATKNKSLGERSVTMKDLHMAINRILRGASCPATLQQQQQTKNRCNNVTKQMPAIGVVFLID